MNKVLVTGGAGFIGSHIAELLLNEGFEPIIIDNLSTGNPQFIPPGVKFYHADITSPDTEKVFSLEKPNYVIHQAAQVDVGESIKDPEKDAWINVLGTIRLLTYAKQYNARKFIFASSCAVYGDAGDCSIQEDHPIHPLSFYGASKHASEQYIKLFHQLYGLSYTILRYANVYGPRQTPKGEGGVIYHFISKILNGEHPVIFGDGEQSRDFVYVKDVAKANVLSLKHGDNETLNISCDQKTSINQLYHLLKSMIPAAPLPKYLPKRNGDILFSRLANEQAKQKIGWHPTSLLTEGLEETIRYYFMQKSGGKHPND